MRKSSTLQEENNSKPVHVQKYGCKILMYSAITDGITRKLKSISYSDYNVPL